MNNYIAIDVSGGDNAPGATVQGCVMALEESRARLILAGKPDEIEAELKKYSYDKGRLEICPASENIGFDEQPTLALRRKKDSSLVKGLALVKEGRAGAFVSAGSTGALMAGALTALGRIKGVDRPAIAAMLPCETGLFLLLDTGANVDCKPQYLKQFAQMGALYMEHVAGVKNPRVALVNIGAEKEKGDSLTKEAYALLEASGLNFIGSAEARDIPAGAADVVVCDGFVGNVILKYTEGFSKFLLTALKRELTSHALSKLGALLSKGAFASLKARFDPSEVGGAAFLGLNGLVVKAHGSSDARAFKNAVKQCELFLQSDVVGKIAANASPEGEQA